MAGVDDVAVIDAASLGACEATMGETADAAIAGCVAASSRGEGTRGEMRGSDVPPVSSCDASVECDEVCD